MSGSYDNEWIIRHKADYRYWSEMYVDYMKEHPDEDHTCGAFVQRTRKLGLNRNYSKEQDDWLKANYPVLGAKEAHKRFCELFQVKKGYQGFKSHITDLGLKVTEKRWREACQNNGHRERVPVGTIRQRSRNSEWIMTENGWMPLQKYVVGDIPDGCVVIHLDRNGRNNDPSNLAVISKETQGLMTGSGFWSDNPEITKTGIVWCELSDALKKSEAEVVL